MKEVAAVRVALNAERHIFIHQIRVQSTLPPFFIIIRSGRQMNHVKHAKSFNVYRSKVTLRVCGKAARKRTSYDQRAASVECTEIVGKNMPRLRVYVSRTESVQVVIHAHIRR